jgi:murein DD-endopeptidase MepM/ murein hydrolase activator NlpD
MLRKILLFLSVTLILTGCSELFLHSYGTVASDEGSVRENGGPVFLPEGASTISQGFNPHPEPQPGGGREGIDIYAATGTPVIAPAAGIVTESYFEPFYGNHSCNRIWQRRKR